MENLLRMPKSTAGCQGCNIVQWLSLCPSWPVSSAALLPGGAEQSQACERPGGRQVSAAKEARPVSVPHKSGEGNKQLRVTAKYINSSAAHSKTRVWYDLTPTYIMSFISVPGQVDRRPESRAMSHLCSAPGTGGETEHLTVCTTVSPYRLYNCLTLPSVQLSHEHRDCNYIQSEAESLSSRIYV